MHRNVWREKQARRIRLALFGLVVFVALAIGGYAASAHDHTRGGVACGVHYTTTLVEAERHFRGAGFQDVRDMSYLAGWEQGQTQYNCDLMRRKARAYDHAGVCLSFYEGVSDWSDSRCSVYRFAYGRYTGPIGNLGRQ